MDTNSRSVLAHEFCPARRSHTRRNRLRPLSVALASLSPPAPAKKGTEQAFGGGEVTGGGGSGAARARSLAAAAETSSSGAEGEAMKGLERGGGPGLPRGEGSVEKKNE